MDLKRFFSIMENVLPDHSRAPDEISDLCESIKRIIESDLRNTSIDELKMAIEPALSTQVVMHVFPPAGTEFYRARRMSSKPVRASELSYPPAHFIQQDGRLNRAGQSVFYCCTLRSGACFEVKPQLGEMLAISQWKLQSPVLLLWLGFSKQVLNDFKPNARMTLWMAFIRSSASAQHLH